MSDLKPDNPKKYTVALEGMPGNGDPVPTLNLIFATLCFCFWANAIGLLGEGATLAIGVLQVAVFVGYTIGAILLFNRGNAFGGNVFLVFATFFGTIGGFSNIMLAVSQMTGIPFDYKVSGICFIVSGLFLLFALPGLLTAPKTDFLCFLTGGIGVLGFGLTGAEILPPVWNIVAAWALFIDGVIASYCVVALMLGFCGIELTLGTKPFISPSEPEGVEEEAVNA
ncbi:MAG: hypothetical protein VB081_03315 [Christensenella sp.]|uniref:hypothetical protein n=1 Tax=Christensenella sp. TaxID=1935934 RepID=UPI002B1FE59E|nr:hypothetical protein [Christensenella sp.]MEA5002506.1 hypothetical protein [Christensenella sp.]